MSYALAPNEYPLKSVTHNSQVKLCKHYYTWDDLLASWWGSQEGIHIISLCDSVQVLFIKERPLESTGIQFNQDHLEWEGSFSLLIPQSELNKEI